MIDYKPKLYSSVEREQIISESSVSEFKKDHICLKIAFGKRYKRSFATRLKKAEQILLDLQGKLECDKLSEKEFKKKDAIEEEIEELRQAIENIEKFK